MSSQDSVKKSVIVEASRDVAFHVFTAKMTAWWPSGHHIGKSPIKDIVLEPRVGGRWSERGEDGSECDWGRVLAWEPTSRFVLAWQLTADFKFDANFETEVEVRFFAEGPARTRVELEHRNLDRYGARQGELRATFDSGGGWQLGLERFVAAAAAQSEKKYFLLRLIPPRPTFAMDMSEHERRVMQEHVVYWTGHAQEGTVVAFGPVADPKGAWGVAIIGVDSEATVQKLTGEDPAMVHAIGAHYETLSMPQIVLGR